MKSMFLFAFGVFAVFQTAYSINCYYCIGSQSDCTKERMDSKKDLFLGPCREEYDRCYRHSIQIADVKGVYVACSNAADCKRHENTCKEWTSKDHSCKVECCQKDACNDSVLVNYNLLLLAISNIISLCIWL
ncbi:uncharacterized protein [Porites lutea]|uniref:uncharacterized protein n=1 Tax=Porites lutea TaxID=51062 RepID=UPI003CC64A5B